MTDQIEYLYMQRNMPYQIEKEILKSMDEFELQEFIKDMYNEYLFLKNKLDAEYEEKYQEYDLNELSKYFVEYMIYQFSNEWERYNILKSSLERIDKHLWRDEYQENYWITDLKKIDIHDVPITQVIWRYMNLPKSLNRNIKCPLHKDKTPSFRIYKHSNSFYCFWCQRWGNAINFISYIENCSTKEAFKDFATLYFK